jgi:transketolase C-terminal domain/subunit
VENGISEQNAVGVTAGTCKAGLYPVFGGHHPVYHHEKLRAVKKTIWATPT